jgi:hypothetical protein
MVMIMRKITEEAVNAFYNPYLKGNCFNKGNTWVTHSAGLTTMYLHGHAIAKIEDGKLFVNHCGYRTATTKERLNGLAGVHIVQKNWVWFLNGKPMESGWNLIE